ncbi:MAG TPA: hypothetical protein DEF06_01000 [Clostridiales bacterium]|nr:hypothetical protein [Clostridiales bacterium]
MEHITILFLTAVGLQTVSIILLLFQLAAVKRLKAPRAPKPYCEDAAPPRFFITGDKHRDFSEVRQFCRDRNTRRKDVLIILGDSGFNYYEDARDDKLKAEISRLQITLLCLHGNKEC